jgi:hypothetical protein
LNFQSKRPRKAPKKGGQVARGGAAAKGKVRVLFEFLFHFLNVILHSVFGDEMNDQVTKPLPVEKNAEGQELFCICRRPMDDRRIMIGYTAFLFLF